MVAAVTVLAGCGDLLGTKDDPTVDEIFIAGRQEPGQLEEAEYVPLFPFFTQGAGDAGTFDNPHDVYVGYDEFIYVVDDDGLHMLNLAGQPVNLVAMPYPATSVIQDRRLDVYVTSKRDTTITDPVLNLTRTWTLPVVYHYSGLTSGTAELVDIIWHPFDDDTRKFNRPDPVSSDEEAEFTGVAVLPDNRIYVSRRGTINNLNSVILPHNVIMMFSPEGENIKNIISLSPTRPSLQSAVYPGDVMTFVQPPQRDAFPLSEDFLIAQTPSAAIPLTFPVLSIKAVETPDGIVYQQDAERLVTAQNPDRGAGFLYEESKFLKPTDLAYAADVTNYIFVLDGGKDSLFVFNRAGIEGVTPPTGSNSLIPVVVSFGGSGDGARQFNRPEGVAYFQRVVYVADTGNNRIARFRLNTDFE